MTQMNEEEEKQALGYAVVIGMVFASVFTGYEVGLGWGTAVFGLLIWVTALTTAVTMEVRGNTS